MEERRTFACEQLQGMVFSGRQRPGSWKVETFVRAAQAEDSSGFFSAGYVVRHSDGTRGYMKATDLSVLTDPSDEFLVRVNNATTQHRFERDILSICHGNNLDRVVMALDYGEENLRIDDNQEFVFYLIFELAERDCRDIADIRSRYDLQWKLTALHNLSVAVSQLHRSDIAHNDIKPSNLLQFDDFLQKLADLGRAIRATSPGPYDEYRCAGDTRFAAPELLYRVGDSSVASEVPFELRRASDTYLLGSTGYFFFTGQMLTPIIFAHMREEHLPLRWHGDFDGVLPYIREGYCEAMAYLKSALPNGPKNVRFDIGARLNNAILQLCDPDPRFRGHPANRAARGSSFSVERYVTLFDLLRKHASIVRA